MTKYLDSNGLIHYDNIVTEKINRKQDKIPDIDYIRAKANDSITALFISGTSLVVEKGEDTDSLPLPDVTGGKISNELIDSLFN